MRRASTLPVRFAPAFALALAAATLTCDGNATAQTRDPAAAQAFFAEGRALLKQGRYPEACSKFEASQKLDPGNGTLMNLADCYEKSGRLASAWLSFHEAAAAASSAGQAARASHARGRAASIEPRLCRLRVDVDPANTALVLRDDKPLDRSVWGQAVPVDPGRHTVVVRNGELVLFLRDIEVEPAKTDSCATQEVSVPPFKAAASAVAVSGPATDPMTGAPSSGGPAASPATASSSPSMPGNASTSLAASDVGRPSVLPLVVAGVGVVAMGAGTYFGFRAKAEWGDARSKCVAAGCGPEAQSLATSARTDAGIGTIAFIGGAALTVGGVVWWLLTPARAGARGSGSGAQLELAPAIHGDARGLVASGRF